MSSSRRGRSSRSNNHHSRKSGSGGGGGGNYTSSDDERNTRLKEGMKVEARFGGRDKWYKGKITNARSDGTCIFLLFFFPQIAFDHESFMNMYHSV